MQLQNHFDPILYQECAKNFCKQHKKELGYQQKILRTYYNNKLYNVFGLGWIAYCVKK